MKSYPCLKKLLRHYQKDNDIKDLSIQLKKITHNIDNVIALYHQAIPLIEKNIWKNDNIEARIIEYQQLFKELEALISNNKTRDLRHHFIIAIPVADRPQHLNTCLNSVLKLCKNYNYGGLNNGFYTKIKVLIADDSQQIENINENKNIATNYTNRGLAVEYFGQAQQKEILNHLNKKQLINITGNNDNNHFFHKGASITRNITYLKLQHLQNENESSLFYFIDSDQAFQVNIQTGESEENTYAINYFYYLDQIFSRKKTSILTGKVVGDPPVSPAVMAGTFLDDLIAFIQRIAKLEPDRNCRFHNTGNKNNKNAIYHDMADLFGFKDSAQAHEYHCTLNKQHNNNDCFNDLSNKLNLFFYGVHSTRKSTYTYQNAFESLSPARTIYTGNYIFKPKYLKYFIPFANLKLRMAGPTLGRIIQAELGDKFVSANLPMLHKRTIDTSGTVEFRPGVAQQDSIVDLSGEFIRQFFGDVMLFSMIQLTKIDFPKKVIPFETIENIVHETIESLQTKYALKQNEIMSKTNQLNALINDSECWWNKNASSSSAKLKFEAFINNITFNFNKNAIIYKTIHSKETVASYQKKIAHSIMDYHDDMKQWETALSNNTSL